MYRRNKRPFGSILPARNETEGLRVKITYYKVDYTFPTGLADTEHHKVCLRNMLNHIYTQIQEGVFRFAEVFKYAPLEKKRFFSNLENSGYTPRPDELTLREFITDWLENWMEDFSELPKTPDYESAIKRILEKAGDKTFAELKRPEDMDNFARSIDRIRGEGKGGAVSVKRKKHILNVLQRIWKAAVGKYSWILGDPFSNVYKHITELEQVKRIKAAKGKPVNELFEDEEFDPRKVFLPSEFERILAVMDPRYCSVTKFMVMTMMIPSEIEGLLKIAVPDKIKVRLKRAKDGTILPMLKTAVRPRDIRLTTKIAGIIDEAVEWSGNDHVFTMADGSPFRYASYYKTVWLPAIEKAGLDHRVGYSLRHTGIGWSMLLKVDHDRLFKLAGHRDKSMIYRNYGDYRDGLYEEREKVLVILGEDYLLEGELKAFHAAGPAQTPVTDAGIDSDKKTATVDVGILSDKFSDKQRLYPDNYL